MQWQGRPVPTDHDGKAALHDTTVSTVCATSADDGSLEEAVLASVPPLADQHQLALRLLHGAGTTTVAQKGGDGMGSAGHTPQQGEQVIAIIDHHG